MNNSALEKYGRLVKAINNEYITLSDLSNDELRSRMLKISDAINSSDNKIQALDLNLVQVYAIVKETAHRLSAGNLVVTESQNDRKVSKLYDFVEIKNGKATYKNHWDVMGVPYIWNMVHYDEQLLGGILLHYGFAVEMATGEGKTLVATLPVFLNALAHGGVHLMTSNDYLSKRDYEITRPLYIFYGLTVGCIEYYTRSLNNHRKDIYTNDITFGTYSSFIFDYLYDHIAITKDDCFQLNHNFAIIDELDSILIDDADEPHILSGGNRYNNERLFKENYLIVKELLEHNGDKLYESNLLNKSASFTKEGKAWLSVKKGIDDLFSIERPYEIADFEKLPKDKQDEIYLKLSIQNVFNQLLLAQTVYIRDIDYIVENNKVIIIDQHTGRAKESHRWEYGLHTAVEIKENVEVQDDYDSIAVISIKNYFRLYGKIAGMSGTLKSIENELNELYGLQCASLPTHKPIVRKDHPLRIFKTAEDKDNAIIKTIIENQQSGRPTLVGNISIKRSEEICHRLDKAGIKYNKLDAKTNRKSEALVIANSGWGNTITIATSIAGRGTDIKPSIEAINNGGLMVIGTDLFESVRVARQLKGRSGRQGDPGSSIFFASLEDQILNYLNVKDYKYLMLLSAKYNEPEISFDEVRLFFEKAQTNREALCKELRINTARKDDIIAPLRRKFYDQRNSVLFSAETAEKLILNIIQSSATPYSKVEGHLKSLYDLAIILVHRYSNNNPGIVKIPIPFSYNSQPFMILIDAMRAKSSFEYFSTEFKRQIILQIYDKEWKKLVLYTMSNLDTKEIDELDNKYHKMMEDIDKTIINYLQYATCIFDVKKMRPTGTYGTNTKDTRKRNTPPAHSDYCPCGSGKKYCECHGKSDIRRRTPKRR